MSEMKLFYSSGFGFFDGLGPDEPYRRGQFVHGLTAYAGLSPVLYRGTFSDVVNDDPFAGDWQVAWDEHWLDEADIVRPNDVLTARELTALLSRVTDLGLTDPLWQECTGTCGIDPDSELRVKDAQELLEKLLEKLDSALFLSPTAKYRIHPMEHDVSKMPETVRQLVIDTHGGGAVINAAWDDKWNGDPVNLDNLYKTARILHDAGLHVWLYDEKVYPSGWAAGYIMQDGKDHLAKNIGVLKLNGEGVTRLTQGLPDRGIRFIQAAFYKGGDYSSPIAADWAETEIDTLSPEGKWEFIAFFIRPCNIWPYAFAKTIDPPIGPREHLNFLNRDAVAAFIEGALGRVKDHDPDFGLLFEAVFTDEPALQSIYIYGDANKPSFRSVPYGNELFSRYREEHGEDLTPLLPYLFFGNDERARSVRVAFYRTIASLMSDNFTGQVADWCHENHVNYSGHYHSEEQMYYHVGNYGDFLKTSSKADRPGFDMLLATHADYWKTGEGVNNGATFLGGKFISSVSRMKGGNTTMVEVCPVIHDAEMKKHIESDFMGLSTDTAFIGATHFNNYGYHFLHDNDVFRRWNDYTGRLCEMLRGARSDAEIAVYYPIEDAQAGMYEPDDAMDSLSDEEVTLQNYLEKLEYNLLLNRLDFNLVTGDAVLSGAIENGMIQCGATMYRVILMPHVTVIPLGVMRRLDEFRKSGGTVLWLDTLPAMGLDAKEHPEVRRIAAEMKDLLTVFRPDNLAMRARVTADHTAEGDQYKPEYVTNGSIVTSFSWEGWSSDKLPASLELELPEVQTVNRLDLYSKSDYEQTAFDAFWHDGKAWQPLVSVSGNEDTHCFREFSPVRSKRFMIRFTEGCRQQPGVARATEIQLYHVRYSPDKDDLMSRLHTILGTALEVNAEPGSIFVSRYRRGNRPFYYIINPTVTDRNIRLMESGADSLRIYQPLDGSITDSGPEVQLTLKAGRGIFLEIIKKGAV
ncbi:MAG: hypothetical protein J5950_09100 [Clostridia bacterium]|nr:hypothetical protein [Clostridia bacterium]